MFRSKYPSYFLFSILITVVYFVLGIIMLSFLFNCSSEKPEVISASVSEVKQTQLIFNMPTEQKALEVVATLKKSLLGCYQNGSSVIVSDSTPMSINILLRKQWITQALASALEKKLYAIKTAPKPASELIEFEQTRLILDEFAQAGKIQLEIKITNQIETNWIAGLLRAAASLTKENQCYLPCTWDVLPDAKILFTGTSELIGFLRDERILNQDMYNSLTAQLNTMNSSKTFTK